MLESMINPKRMEKGPWKMLFIGLLYGSLSLLLVHWFFSPDPALGDASGIMVVLFCIMFTLPFMFFITKTEEKEDEEVEGLMHVWKAHKDAIYALMWLFVGFIIAFSFWNIVLQDANLLNFQLETYCSINSPGHIEQCVQHYSPNVSSNTAENIATGAASKGGRFLSIIENNIYVLIFTIIFSLIFGAGAIFILIWNASVISAAVGVFTNYQIKEIPLGIARYMIHGIPEIASYFIAALAGGIFGIGILRNGFKSKKSLRVIENSMIMVFIALVVLIVAALIEVYITPGLF